MKAQAAWQTHKSQNQGAQHTVCPPILNNRTVAFQKKFWDRNRTIATFLSFLLVSATVAQATTYVLGRSALLEGPSAGSDSVVLAVTPTTSTWTATTNAAWLHLTDPFQSGIGSTNVVFSFDANPGATRSATLIIGDQILTVTQVGSTYISAQTMNTLVSSGLNQPHGVAVDGIGNLFIADSGNNTIKKWTYTNHTVTTLVSSGLSNPYSEAVNAAGNVYIADRGNNAIKEWVAANSNVTTLMSSLYSPSGVAVDATGNVYIADGYSQVIYEWLAASSNVITLNSLTPPYICNPPSVAVDIAGNIYFADTCGDSLVEWTAFNGAVNSLSPGWFYNPTGVAVDGSGNVYIADQADNWVWKWSAVDGSLGAIVSGFNRPGWG